MDEVTYRGIILKHTSYGDAHRMLWIFTAECGIIKAVRYGVKGKKSSNAAAFQLLSYGDFRLRPSNSDIMTAVGAEVKEGFYPISENIQKLALAAYLCDITYGILGEGNPDPRLLSLLLNALYALAYRDEELLKIKCVYEMKMMCAEGYMPNVASCPVCGGASEYFRFGTGEAVCRMHHSAEDMKLCGASLALMRYLVSCEDKKMLAFETKDNDLYVKMNALTEKYISVQCDRTSKQLAYFYSILEI